MTRDRTIRYGITGIGLLLLIYVLFYYACEPISIRWWANSGFRESQTVYVAGPPVRQVFQSVYQPDFVKPPYPVAGDTLLAIADTIVVRRTLGRFTVDKPVALDFLHGGDTLRTTFAMHAPAPLLVWHLSLVELLRLLVTLCSLGVGLWALRSRGDSLVVRIFALYSFSFAALVTVSYYYSTATRASLVWPLGLTVFRLWHLLARLYGPFWLHLQLLYPRPFKIAQRHPFWIAFLCYLPAVVTDVLQILTWSLPGPMSGLLPNPARNNISLVILTAQLLTATGILLYRYRRSDQGIEMRQLRLMSWAVGTGTVLFAVVNTLFLFFPAWYNARLYRDLDISTVQFVAMLIGPLAFAYAFRKYRLMEVEGRLKRATRNALVSGTLILVLIAITYGASHIMRATLGVTSLTPSMAIAFVLALGILPAQRKLRGLVEQRLYPERQMLRNMLHDFLQQASTLPDQRLFWQELEQHLREGLKVEAMYPVLKGSMSPAFSDDSSLLTYLAQDQRPLLVDEALGSGRVEIQAAEVEWLTERQIGLILPLVLHRELIGFLAIGLRPDKEDYDAEELHILNSLAPQIAVASENLKLLEENVVKRELELQLQMARRIQEGFLPQQIPPTPGLEVAAVSRFCLDVAGDYYDVVPLKDGRTVLAIGDVSGKGAGAAMIMANLQAALRTAVRMNVPLAVAVSEINHLIYQNTPPEQYITFFAAIFDPATSMFSYVNAGHNAPILAHADGTLELLQEGGVILGCMPSVAYTQAQVGLCRGDMLLLFTDGVSEAMNANDVEFGEDRVGRVVSEHCSASPQALLDIVEHEVVVHHGATTFEDDFTLLMIKKS